MNLCLLDKINSPNDLKSLDNKELEQLSKEIRRFIIANLANTGGHLGANLGVVELTLALHKVFSAPKDKIIWDIGHQSYVHKIVTGRKELFATLRQKGGISGFTNRSESEFDHFGAGHSSTAISAALGIAVAKNFLKEQEDILAVIGDASIVSGMAFEGLNHAGSLDIPNFTVVLNDNNKSILNSVGALNAYFSKLTSSYSYAYIREHSKTIIDSIPFGMGKLIKDMEKYLRNLTNNGFFEALGFFYIGPIDGHNFKHLIPILINIKNNKHKSKPILLHVITKKGKGYLPAEEAEDSYHGVGKFCAASGKLLEEANKASWSLVFGKELTKQATEDDKIIAITAGTLAGVGLNNFAEVFKGRTFDVGIAEQHAVTFAAGLAAEKFKPYVCLYSTFSQRAYDQIVHDVCLQSLPVRFVLDRSGFVGADGATHHGLLNHTMYLPLPNIVYMSPFTLEEFTAMLQFMRHINDKPSFISFPKGIALAKSSILELLNNVKSSIPNKNEPKLVNNIINQQLNNPKQHDNNFNNKADYYNFSFNGIQFGKAEILQEGQNIAVIAVGALLKEVILASIKLAAEGIFISIVNPRFLKPLDYEVFSSIITNHKVILTLEESYGGGFFAEFYNFYQQNQHLNPNIKINGYWVADKYFEHDNSSEQLKKAKLNADYIYSKIKLWI